MDHGKYSGGMADSFREHAYPVATWRHLRSLQRSCLAPNRCLERGAVLELGASLDILPKVLEVRELFNAPILMLLYQTVAVAGFKKLVHDTPRERVRHIRRQDGTCLVEETAVDIRSVF